MAHDNESDTPVGIHLIPLDPRGRSFIALFTESGQTAPDPAVGHELRASARYSKRGQQRGILTELLDEAQSGVVGNAASAVLGGTLTATTQWLRRRSSDRLRDGAAAVGRLRTAATEILGRAPSTFQVTSVTCEDSRWKIEALVEGERITAALDATGSLLEWAPLSQPTAP
ncbi:hypothetical protein [Streptomyces sp. NPDC046976]|uniref:hypothetical protein n=1 Tax=Streptomyces sp. NPDC046976 TaxID=3155258 RepID=UPI0033C837C7